MAGIKKRAAILAAACLMLAACSTAASGGTGTTASSTSTSSAAGKKYVIGVSEPVGGNPWRELALATLLNLANQPQYADRVEIKIVRTQNNDAAAQNAAMRNLISSGVDALIFDPASPTAADPVIAEASSRNIPVVAAAQDVSNPNVYVVATDYDAAGTLSAQWLAGKLTGKKNVAFFEGIKGAPINESAVPKAKKILEDAGANIVVTSTSGWDDATAQKNMAAVLQSGQEIDAVYVYLAGGIGIVNAFTQAGKPYVPVATGAGYNNEPCTMKKLQPKGLQMISVSGQQAIYAKALEQTLKILEGEQVEKKQFFPPRQLSTDEMGAVDAACLADKPDLFGINYEFPGLSLPLEDTLKYYKGAQ